MLRRISCCLVYAVVLVCLMGADSVNLSSSTPNPGGVKSQMDGAGDYAVDPNYKYDEIRYSAVETTTKQLSAITAKPVANGKDWSATLKMVAGTYDTQATLFTIKVPGGGTRITLSNEIKGVVLK